jgi:hypothetical protein
MKEPIGYLSFEFNVIDSVRIFVSHEGSLANPKTDVKVMADVWFITNEGTQLSKKRKQHLMQAPGCDVDLKSRTITTPSGKIIEASNLEEVVDGIEKYIGNL